MGGRNNILNRYEVINEIGLAATKKSLISSVQQLDIVRYIVIWANGALNNFSIEVQTSDFEDFINPKTGLEEYVVTDFGSTPAIATASGNHVLDIENVVSKYMRLQLTRTAGAMDVIVTIRGASTGA